MTTTVHSPQSKNSEQGAVFEVLLVFLKLGLTCFGGPIAHIGYFRDEFVTRRRWLDEQAYADLVALCQFLPGPASSQVGFSVGLMRAGYLGGLEHFPLRMQRIQRCGSSWRIHLAGRHRGGVQCGSRGPRASARRPFVAGL